MLWYISIGFVIGMIVSAIFIPPTSTHKVLPDPNKPEIIFKNPKVENGFFQVKAVETPCTSETDSLNLLSMLHKW